MTDQTVWTRNNFSDVPYQWTQNGFVVPNPYGHGLIRLPEGSEYVKSSRTRAGDNPAATTEFVGTSGSHSAFVKELKSEDSYRSAFDGSFDNGHEFLSEKHVISYPQRNSTALRVNGTYGTLGYTGSMSPSLSVILPPETDFPSQDTIMADGRKLIGMTIPTKAEAGLAQFLGECRERLPSLIGMTTLKNGATAKKIGDEHLNIQFGIKPFIKDLQKLARAVLQVNKMTSQFQRDSGQNIRRKRRLGSTSRYESRGSLGGNYPSMGNFYFQNMASELYYSVPEVLVADNYSSEVWFSGAYTYHLSEAHSFLGKMNAYEEKANHLLGTRLTADVVWNLTPWSWLLDWFGDTGTFMSNVSLLSDDSQVLRYGYVMHETHATRSYTQLDCQLQVDAVAPRSLSLYYEVVRKQRTRATPYGFNVDLNSLTASQVAIMAALGLSKGGTNLR